MTIYIYRVGESAPVQTIPDVVAYTDGEIRTEDGSIYAPFISGVEFSSKADCSETLREKYRTEHPTAKQRVEELEALVAQLLFGGEGA